eukprot:SAG22_NODE_1498_length_4288_cov_3.110289_3_plen_86_part_00
MLDRSVPTCLGRVRLLPTYNRWLLTSMARDFWNRSDMTIQSDCGTLQYMTANHHFTESSAEAAADFFNAGGAFDRNVQGSDLGTF